MGELLCSALLLYWMLLYTKLWYVMVLVYSFGKCFDERIGLISIRILTMTDLDLGLGIGLGLDRVLISLLSIIK